MSTDFLAEKDAHDIVTRLRRVEGQVRGIQKMVEDRRECGDIVQQLVAARSALDRVGNQIVASGLRGCLSEAHLDPETSARISAGLEALTALRG
ncbi:MAG TPA: metal-sensitive transcriptional regulator [Chloroflexota bacterium]|nr:metal-sensitive transcriptional regulator [Chloroflexota bacterium]